MNGATGRFLSTESRHSVTSFESLALRFAIQGHDEASWVIRAACKSAKIDLQPRRHNPLTSSYRLLPVIRYKGILYS